MKPSKYDDAFAPRDPSELAAARAAAAVRAATLSLQSSLYNRLRVEFGNANAGVIAWMLIRAADPLSPHHDAACVAMAARTSREVGSLFEAAEGALNAAKGPEAAALAKRVFDVVGVEIARIKRERGIT